MKIKLPLTWYVQLLQWHLMGSLLNTLAPEM